MLTALAVLPVVADPVVSQWLDAIDTLGTLGLVVVAIFAFYTRRIRTKSEVEERVKEVEADADERILEVRNDAAARMKAATDEWAERLRYMDERRAEERRDKIAAYQRLETLTNGVEELARLLQGVREEVIRGTAQGRTHD